jgi:hypothetical protein
MRYPLSLNYGLYGKVKQGFQPEIKTDQTRSTTGKSKNIRTPVHFFPRNLYESSCPDTLETSHVSCYFKSVKTQEKACRTSYYIRQDPISNIGSG